MLPPGQKVRPDFPRFGLPAFVDRFPDHTADCCVEMVINKGEPRTIDLASADFPQSELVADFSCVTTWTYLGLTWGGVRFTDLLDQVVDSADRSTLAGAVFRAQDGAKTSLLMEDLLDDTVLLAMRLDGEALPIKHGAPVRLVAPKHYGYKNVKHLSRIELYSEMPAIKRGFQAFLDHPRARLQHEERGRWVPGWILRYPYRALIKGTVKQFAAGTERYQARQQ